MPAPLRQRAWAIIRFMEELAIEISRANAADAAEVLALQHLAFRAEAQIYGDWSLPPLLESIEEITKHITEAVLLKAVLQSKIVGAVRGKEESGACVIERLAVLPSLQRRGIGSRLMSAIEARFPNVDRFVLYTGHRSCGNIRLYQRLGYRVFRTEPWSASVSIVFLERPLA